MGWIIIFAALPLHAHARNRGDTVLALIGGRGRRSVIEIRVGLRFFADE